LMLAGGTGICSSQIQLTHALAQVSIISFSCSRWDRCLKGMKSVRCPWTLTNRTLIKWSRSSL
jgi:hypothetical protein